jgi:hypothetical protein
MILYQCGAITVILSLLQIPMELKDWNIQVLDSLLNYRWIERDSFDFKGRELNKLETHLCAMANTVIGILALGVDDPSSDNPDDPNAIFTKNGFRKGTEIQILNSICNSVAKVDPLPRVTHKPICDPQIDRFYMILKVEGLESQRPYQIKDTAQIFVRIGGSTRPASRTTIANLFVNLLEKRSSIRRLQVHSSLLRSELILAAEVIETVDNNYTGIIPLLDLQAFKDAVLSAEWFLSEQNLLGSVDSNTGSTTGGLYVNIHELNILNTTIDCFNKEQFNRGVRYTSFMPTLEKWKLHRGEFKNIIGSLEDIVNRCTKFLQSS